MILENKNTVIYGGGEAIGSAVARAFAREGARVFLAGRTREKLEAVVEEIRSAGGIAEAAVLDALDERAVDEHADAVAVSAGSIDISFNLISRGDAQGTPLIDMTTDDLLRAVINGLRSNFSTARAAARRMVEQGSGVILTFGGNGGRETIRDYYIGGTQVAVCTIDVLRRQLAAELGPHDIRVVTLQSGGVPEAIPEDSDGRDAIVEMIVGATMLGRAATFEDLGNVAAFAASDLARTITGTNINITSGAVAD